MKKTTAIFDHIHDSANMISVFQDDVLKTAYLGGISKANVYYLFYRRNRSYKLHHIPDVPQQLDYSFQHGEVKCSCYVIARGI